MTQEEKELLLKDLCARLPYGVILQLNLLEGETINSRLTGIDEDGNLTADVPADCAFSIENAKPYLRILASMTKEEKQESRWYQHDAKSDNFILYMNRYVEWLDSKHFDWRTDGNGKTMIEIGLALEGPEGMYNTKITCNNCEDKGYCSQSEYVKNNCYKLK